MRPDRAGAAFTWGKSRTGPQIILREYHWCVLLPLRYHPVDAGHNGRSGRCDLCRPAGDRLYNISSMPMFTFEHQSPDRLSQFAESLANYHYSPLKRQARRDCRHDNIRPARASSKYTKSSAQNGYVAEQVVAGANPRRSHVRVRSKVCPQQAKRDAVRNEGSNSNSAHCCRSGERGARHLDRGKLSGTIGARQGVGGEIMESGHGAP